MSEQLKQLQELEAQLHEVNQAFARAARPLALASDLNDEQRRQIGAQLRAAQGRWEVVTRQISEVFQTGSADGR
jgi:hypothetical protein